MFGDDALAPPSKGITLYGIGRRDWQTGSAGLKAAGPRRDLSRPQVWRAPPRKPTRTPSGNVLPRGEAGAGTGIARPLRRRNKWGSIMATDTSNLHRLSRKPDQSKAAVETTERREKGLWTFLTWSFFLSQAIAADQALAGSARVKKGAFSCVFPQRRASFARRNYARR
jgi:hypothetical protein